MRDLLNRVLELCPVCKSQDMQTENMNEVFTYAGHSVTVKNYTIVKCGNCGEYFPTSESSKRAEAAIRILHKKSQNNAKDSKVKDNKTICKECNTEVVERILDHADSCIELGEVLYRDFETMSCSCGKDMWFNPEQIDALENRRRKIIAELISKLPLGMFIPKEKDHPTRFVITTKLGKQTLIYRPSLAQHASTGDGRMNLVAELAKHNIAHTFHVSRITRQGRIEA